MDARGVPLRSLSSIPGVARVLHAPGLVPSFSSGDEPGIGVGLIVFGVCGAGLAGAAAGADEAEDVEVAGRFALELGLDSLDVCDGGDFDRDTLRELPASGRSGDSAFFARRGELTGVTSSPGGAEPLHGSCSGSISSTGREVGGAGKGGS